PRDVRAPRLEDVIFNGTDHTAPLSMAEVSLTIDNARGLLPISFTEVTMTRRVYRSGESECFINQSPCRLKDIQELFLGTGLGGGTYAIIEQGHIDMVLSSKPEERRVVFEEASGVAKYLSKKHEAMRRLDETEGHLTRIADIILEVRKQVSALERAANKARQYRTQWDQLKQLELRLASDELRSGVLRASQLEESLKGLREQSQALESRKQEHMSHLEGANASVSAIQQRLQDLKTKIVERIAQIEQNEGQKRLKAQWIEELKQQVAQREVEAEQLRQRIHQIEEQALRLSGGEAELREQLGSAQQQLAKATPELSDLETLLQGSLTAIAGVKAQLFAAATEASHQRNQMIRHTSQLQALKAQIHRITEQHQQRMARKQEIQQRCAAAQQEVEALKSKNEQLQQRLEESQNSLEAVNTRRHEGMGRLHQLRDQLAVERAQTALLENLWRRYEGFPETVKSLLGTSIDGVIGPLADLLQALSGYEEVVEAALGPLAEAIVVRDRQTLLRCRQVLGSQQLESCRFLVLSDCPAVSLALEPVAMQEGIGGAVKQFIKSEPVYQPLVDWLLNDSWVIDDIHRLLNSTEVPAGRLVSPSGDRWDRRSWRFGGKNSSHHLRFGRRQRWEQAQEGLQGLERDFAAAEAESQQAEQAWQSCLTQLESVKGELTQSSAMLHKAQAQLSQSMRELQHIEDEERGWELENQECITEQNALHSQIEVIQRAVDEASAKHSQAEQALAQAQANQEQAQSRKQALAIQAAQAQTTVESLTERLNALVLRQKEIMAESEGQNRQLEEKKRQKEEALGRVETLNRELDGHSMGCATLESERLQLEEESQAVHQSLREEETKRDQLLPQLLKIETEMASLIGQIQEQSQQLSEREFRRSRLVERLNELYQIDEATLQAELQADSPLLTNEQRSSMGEQVQLLRKKLEGIGPVSLGSVEEYDALKRRLEFLQTQEQDLLAARDDLKTSISQINRTARAQFRETFELIRQAFQHYYGRLFSGGEADLILLDQEDVLESGIDIIARPPGKRLQSISLLSGGERALTAVALLFALFKVRPSPFCILDEIDASLDEANVDRFTRVLAEFLSLSQFILITHNKKTITKADSLYGVTMEEPGISKILSAKLTSTPLVPTASEPAAR
ncbi:MAG: chromosome segregation protein SMC, partial [Candidatus Omnitrophica bacterium]|nr:chromosome segregation protein SMC [Candidatus Omnitrophota bacterium]